MRCSATTACLAVITEFLEIGGYCGIQFRGLALLLAQRRGEPRHLLREGLAVILGGLGADVAAGRQDVAMLADVIEPCRLAEAGDVGVSLWIPACAGMTIDWVAAPGVVGAGDLGEVVVA